VISTAVKNRVLPASLVALLLIYLQLRSGIDAYLALVFASAALAYVMMGTGRLLLAAAGAPDADSCAAWTLGLLGTCLAIYALTVALPLTAAAAFGAVAAVVLGLELALARRRRGPLPDWRASIGFALCVAFTAAWCSAPASAYEVMRAQGVLPVWQDFFVHGGLISQFGDPRAVAHQSIYLADFPSSFYHFASYAAAAALAGMLDQPGLPMATAAWLPLGFLAMSAGAYALGERLAGAAGGLAALAAIAILPDASNYGLRNGLFSFHWTLLATPGAAYALGAAFMSLVFLDRWIAERARAALTASALLAVSILLFRAHIFVLYFPAWLATAAFCCAPQRSRKSLIALLLMAALGVAAAGASLGLAQLASTDPGYWRFRGPALGAILAEVHQAQEPTAYTGIYADLASEDAPGFTLAAGIVLMVVAALGAFVVLLPAAMSLAGRFAALRPIDAFPPYLAFCWLLLMLFAPVPWHGDSTELIHRPFVLLYAGAAIWTLCLALRYLATRAGEVPSRLWPTVLAGALLALPAIMVGAQGMASPKFRWAEKDAAPRVEPGLVEAAVFLRKQARVGDIFAAGGLSAEYVPFDFATRLCALTGIPAYLARPYLEMIKDGPRKTVAGARLAALEEVDRQADYAAAIDLLRRLRVQWYAVAGEKGPRWDPGRERAAFSAGTISLYATSTPDVAR
jgi:hypothetical protein